MLSRHHVIRNIPLVAWVGCPGYVPSQDLAHPQPTVKGKCRTGSLDAAQALLSSSQNTGMLINTLLATKTRHSEGCCGEELTPPQPDPIQ